MGTLPRCLCPILTLCFAGLRSSTGGWNGPPESDPWWGTKDALQIRQDFEQERRSGDFASLEKTAHHAAQLARRRHARLAAVRYLVNEGGAQFAEFRYRTALETLTEARSLAREIPDPLDEAAIEVNLSSLYLEMSDRVSALDYAQQAYRRSRGLAHPYFEPHLLLQLGKLYALNDDSRAVEMLTQGIEAARATGDAPQEARGWDLLGDESSRRGNRERAERHFTEAFRIRTLFDRAGLPFSWERIGALRLTQGRLKEAAQFTAMAIQAADRLAPSFPKFQLIHQRGEIERARGETDAALKDFEQAADLASSWRRETLPAIETLTATNVELENGVFTSLVETAAYKAVARMDRSSAIRAFEALEQNRAASLREAAGRNFQNGIPVQYWDLLGELRAEQARLLHTKQAGDAALDRVRAKLTEMESEIGLRTFPKKEENFRSQNSLIHFQQVLSNSELFLSFYLGEQESYVWAVTKDTFSLYRLGRAEEIRAATNRFRDAVRSGDPAAAQFGEVVYRQLFAGLSAGEVSRPDWVISAGDALLEAPLAALVTQRKGSGLKYLVEQHSLRLVPGAMSLAEPAKEAGSKQWLGVGDPVYNQADTRLRRHASGSFSWFARASSPQLNRLVGSAEELRTGAQSWGAPATILEGSEATRERFQSEIARHPAVIHLATHVLVSPQRRDQALIAFGLDRKGEGQFLTTADVAMLSVPGAVVTMAGCETGTGEIRAGAGLVGLTRAWQIAGARAVIATLWPVPDSRGELFSSFYHHLREMPAAQAMRLAQVEMIRSGTWRASAQYWGAYQVNGGAQ